MKNNFCVFVISHGRPNKITTIRTLKKGKFTAPFFVVCDNEDKDLIAYEKNFKNKLLIFDKQEYAKKVDSCDNFQNRRTTTHARNACFDFAQKLGFEFFVVLDDDYLDFRYTFDNQNKILRKRVRNFDKIFDLMFDFLKTNNRINSICMMQTGDMIGAEEPDFFKTIGFPFKKRKAMNSFFCKTDRRFWFFSRLNEDVNTYLTLGNRGGLFFTIPQIYLKQANTQKVKGGMSDAYLASGTYVKSFYTVMNCPSFAVITVTHAIRRMHHKIKWNCATPKILDESFRKI